MAASVAQCLVNVFLMDIISMNSAVEFLFVCLFVTEEIPIEKLPNQISKLSLPFAWITGPATDPS